jgi:hypothetical protein
MADYDSSGDTDPEISSYRQTEFVFCEYWIILLSLEFRNDPLSFTDQTEDHVSEARSRQTSTLSVYF